MGKNNSFELSCDVFDMYSAVIISAIRNAIE